MELQALRYAAMVSALSFDDVVEIYARFLATRNPTADAATNFLGHLGADSLEEARIAEQVRIILLSADFSREITTAVLWLTDQGLDITCFRLLPYFLDGTPLVDVQQLIPLPEAEEYMVSIKKKRKDTADAKRRSRDTSSFRVVSGDQALEDLSRRRAILAVVTHLAGIGVSPDQMQQTIAQKRQRFTKVPGLIDSEEEFIEAAAALAEQAGEQFKPGHWFTADDELIRYGADTYAFNRQWGNLTERKMRDLIAAHGDGKVHFARLR